MGGKEKRDRRLCLYDLILITTLGELSAGSRSLMFMLELRNVSKRFAGIAAVDNVSFTARPGEETGYLGPNGSGKSTTMKMITGLIETSAGQILFDGAPSTAT